MAVCSLSDPLVRVAVSPDVSALDAVRYASAVERMTLPWCESVPLVKAFDVEAGRLSMVVIPGDYAHVRVHRRSPIPGVVSALGLGTLLMCRDGLVLEVRGQHVDHARGALSLSASEGVTMEDLVAAGDLFSLDVRAGTRRALAEELGIDGSLVHVEPLAVLDPESEGLALLTASRVDLSFADVLALHERAEEPEGVLELWPSGTRAADVAERRTLPWLPSALAALELASDGVIG